MTRFTFSIIMIITLLSCTGCVQSYASASVDSQSFETPTRFAAVKLDVQPGGVHKQKIIRDDGSVLRFTISIPENYSEQRPSPLIMALHYGGKVTPFYGRGLIDLIIGPALEDLNSIVVAPDSMGGDWMNAINEMAVIQLMDSVIQSYNVDKSKTLLTGFSMGGVGTWYIAGRNQERFSAAIPISGFPKTDVVDWKIPLYVIHSSQDEVIPLKPTQQYVNALKAKGTDVKLVVIDKVSHFETAKFAKPLRKAVPWIKNVWKQ